MTLTDWEEDRKAYLLSVLYLIVLSKSTHTKAELGPCANQFVCLG